MPQGAKDETEAIPRRINHHDSQTGRGRPARAKADPAARDLRGAGYRWKSKCGGPELNEAKRLKRLEDGNRRLKRPVADQALDIQILKEAALGLRSAEKQC